MSKSKKGGSLASDAVTKLVTPEAFEKMSLNASNVLKGGSVASDAVIKHVTPEAFEKMSLNASNVVKGGRKKSCNNHRAVLVCANCAKKLSGGGSCGAVQQSLKRGGGSCGAAQQSPERGGGSGASSKRSLKNINEYKMASPFKLWNGQGGSEDKPVSIGLKSDASITSFNKLQGTVQNRSMDATAMKILANEDISGPIQMAKTMRFGNVTGTPEFDTKFSYGGGKKRVTKKRV